MEGCYERLISELGEDCVCDAKEKEGLISLHGKYLFPLLELDPSLSYLDLKLQSLVVSYSYFMDDYVDEGILRYRIEAEALLEKLFRLVSGLGFLEEFFPYFKNQMYYLIEERAAVDPYDFFRRYGREGISNKAALFLAITERMPESAGSLYWTYIRACLMLDDFLDYKKDLEQGVLTSVTVAFFMERAVGVEKITESYRFFLRQCDALLACGSATLRRHASDALEYLKRKQVVEKIEEALLANDRNC